MTGRWMALAWFMPGVLGLSGCEVLGNAGQGCRPDGTISVEKVSGDGQRGAAGVPLALRPTVRVADSCGEKMTDHSVSWYAYDGGSVYPGQSRLGSSGQASTVWTLSDEGPDGLNRLDALPQIVGGRSVQFTAHLTNTPATGPAACTDIVLFDPFDDDARWTKTTEATPGFQDSVRFEPTGGVTGGYRRMTHVLSGRGLIVVSHLLADTYTPRVQGPIRRIRYSEDRKQFDPPFAGAAVGSGFLVEQEGRRVALPLPEFRDTTWQRAEMDLVPGAMPGIDSSEAGGSIRFGYYRSNSDSSATVQHGIDNWRVEICR